MISHIYWPPYIAEACLENKLAKVLDFRCVLVHVKFGPCPLIYVTTPSNLALMEGASFETQLKLLCFLDNYYSSSEIRFG